VARREAGGQRIVMWRRRRSQEFGGNARYSHTGFRFVYDGAREIRQFIENDDTTFRHVLDAALYTRENFLADLKPGYEGASIRACDLPGR